MNWQTPKLIAETLCLLAVAGSAAFFAWDTHQTQKQVRVAVYNLSAAAYGANSTIASIDGPCKDIQGDYICPPIPQLSQTEKNIGILAARSAQQAQQVGTLITATAKNLDTVGESVKAAAGSAKETAEASRRTLDALTALFQTANDKENGLPALEDKANGVLGDFQAWERSKALADMQADFARTLENLNAGTKSAAGVTDSLDKMGKHIEKKVDTPKTKGQEIREWVPVGIKAAIQACASGFC